jgi:hypothetical protein
MSPSGWPFEMWPGGPPPGAYLQTPSAPVAGPVFPDVSPERLGAHNSWVEEVVEVVLAVDNPIGRLVLAMSATASPAGEPPHRTCSIKANEPLLRRLLPDLSEGGGQIALRGELWDSDSVQTWFLDSVVAPPTHAQLRVSQKGLFGTRERRLSGWLFDLGSSRLEHIDNYDRFPQIGIATSGSRLYGSRFGLSTEPHAEGEGFNALALAAMATLTNLPALPVRPT